MSGFDHERLDVYAVAIDFVVLANEVVERLPRGRGYLADQLQRAATSIPLDIAQRSSMWPSGCGWWRTSGTRRGGACCFGSSPCS